MAKSLNDVLKLHSDALAGKRSSTTTALTTGENPGVDYADKMKDSRDFIAQHSVEKFDDRVGNGDDVYQATNVKKAKMERHGHEPKPKDIKVYKKNQQVAEAKDNREYDYEGEMAVTKLKTIIRAAEHLIKMMEPNTNLPEWVQSKIIKAEDYITTAHDYLMSEMNEEALEEGGSQYRSAAGSGRNTNSNLSRLARKLSFEKPKSYRPHGTPSKAESKAFLDAEVDKFMKKGGKIKKEEVEELDEAKCNMTEAGKMCEVHGMKDCKKSSGKKLLLDKDIKEKTMTAAEKKKEESLKNKYDDSDMKEKMKKQYGDKKGEQVYFAYIRKQAMQQESISDQRSSKRTSTEEARKEIYKAFLRKKERKEKMKEATTDTTNNYPIDGSNNLGFKL